MYLGALTGMECITDAGRHRVHVRGGSVSVLLPDPLTFVAIASATSEEHFGCGLVSFLMLNKDA